MAAQARGVQFGKPAPKKETVETKARRCRPMMAAEVKTAQEAAEAVGWPRATLTGI